LSVRIQLLRRWRGGERVAIEHSALERIEKLAAAWRRLFKVKQDNSAVADSDIGKLISEAYPERIARQQEKHGNRYKLANGRTVRLPDHDPLIREPWLAVAQLDSGLTDGKIFLAAPLSEDDLIHRATEFEVVNWNTEKGMITAAFEKRIGNVVLASRAVKNVPLELKTKILCDAVRDEGLKLLNWDEPQREWQARVMSLNQWRKEEDWPDVSDEHLLHTLQDWLAPYLSEVNKRQDFQRLELSTILMGYYPGSSRKILTNSRRQNCRYQVAR
jgi:ATP-dependent helicase HrpB